MRKDESKVLSSSLQVLFAKWAGNWAKKSRLRKLGELVTTT
jgi:hypothetical protein